MNKIYQKPNSLENISLHYCPGCTHGIAHRLVAETVDEMGIEGDTIGVSSVGCSYNNYLYFTFDMQQAAHGRAPAVATGIKRVHPDSFVFTYQGDGDLAAIGTAEIVHAAARGENITVVFINNGIYGMTSGQMAPTTLLNQVTTTTPYGRDAKLHGYPIKVCEMLSTLEGAKFVERVSLHDIKNIKNAKRAIRKAFEVQKKKIGFSIVEILSSCPTNWGKSPNEALEFIKTDMSSFYEVKNFKDVNLQGGK